MKKSLILLLVSGLFITLSIISCHKDEKTPVDNETQSAVDNAVADQEYMAIVPATNSHAINTKGAGAQGRTMSICDTLTKISGDTLYGMPGHVNPTYTMNISTAACNRTMADGRNRTGTLYIRLTGKIKIPGSMMIIKLVNYLADSTSYSCDSMVVTTVSSNTLCTSFNVMLNNGICRGKTGWVIKYNLNRTIAFYPHGTDAASIQSATTIYGTASGTNRAGLDFAINIPQSSPLLKKELCPFISSGIMQLTPKNLQTRTIDYSFSISPAPAGGCDDDASFTVNGSTVAFKLK